MDFLRTVWKNYLAPIQAGGRPMISDDENRVLEAVRQCGPLEAYRRLIAENNALIRGSGFEAMAGRLLRCARPFTRCLPANGRRNSSGC